VLTLPECFDDKSETEEREEYAIQFLEAGKDAPVTFEAAKQTLDFIALLIEGSVIAPGVNTIGFGRDHRNHIQREYKLTSFVAFISTVHDHGHARERPQIAKQFASFGRIM
jgi:hypothetical protein